MQLLRVCRLASLVNIFNLNEDDCMNKLVLGALAFMASMFFNSECFAEQADTAISGSVGLKSPERVLVLDPETGEMVSGPVDNDGVEVGEVSDSSKSKSINLSGCLLYTSPSPRD